MKHPIMKFIAEYKKQSAERAGQFFVNRYIKEKSWPELFYEKDDKKALWMIREWFDMNH